ncbi:MAG: hypothetical protein O6952_09765 [Planctomycetota bacterium]|nr:hypothetical protein [Planctomycetota bacterium]
MRVLSALTLLFSILIGGPLAAQEGFRTETVDDRPWSYSDVHFLDVLTYLPPEDWEDAWMATRNGARLSVGSVRTNEFYLDHRIKMEADYGKWLRFRFQVFQMEDFDSRFTRILSGGDIDLTDRVTVGAFTTLLPNKEQMDIGYFLGYVVDRTNYLSLSFLQVDALFNEKSESNDRLTGSPYTLKLQGSLRPVDNWVFSFRVGRDFPLRLEFGDDGFDFRHQKYFYRSRLSGKLSDRWAMVMRLEGENGTRERDYDLAGNPDEMEQERDHFRFRWEFTHELRKRLTATIGFDYFYLYEATLFVNDPAETERILFREATVFGALRIPLPFTERSSFLPSLYVSRFDDDDQFPNDRGRTDEQVGIRTKLGTAIDYVVSDRARLLLNATFRLDRFKFGGGNVQAMFTF